MRTALLVLALAAALAVGTHDSSATSASAKRNCAREGTIISYLRTVRRTPCGTALVGAAPLFRGERVRTGNLGQLTFSTKHLTLCRMEGKGDLTFLPSPTAAVRLDAGRLWCQQAAGVPARLLTKRGVIKLEGTLFGIEATDSRTIVKVQNGFAVVTARSGLGDPAQVSSASQVTLRKGQEPDAVEGFEPTVEDQQAMTAITLDAPEATLGQVRTAIVKAGSAVGVIGETHTLVARAESKLASTKVRFIDWSSVDNFLADENGTGRLPEAGVVVVVLVGSLDALAPAIQRLRDDLDTAVKIFVLPPAQVAP
jgi:hypothetical protein